MNIFAEEIYIGKFDPVLGASRIENKVQKGEDVPDQHLRAFRMGKEEVLYSWLTYVKQLAQGHFFALGEAIDQDRIFQYRFSDVLWKQLRAYIHNLGNLPLWVNLEGTRFDGRRRAFGGIILVPVVMSAFVAMYRCK